MAKCDFCGKGVTFGIKVSHSHRRSNRAWKPNVKRVKAVVNGTPCHVYACTRCLRSNKVERAIRFPWHIITPLISAAFLLSKEYHLLCRWCKKVILMRRKKKTSNDRVVRRFVNR